MNTLKSSAGGTDDSATNIGFSAPLGLQVNMAKGDNVTLGFFSEIKFTYNPTKITVAGADVENTLFSTNILFGVSVLYGVGEKPTHAAVPPRASPAGTKRKIPNRRVP